MSRGLQITTGVLLVLLAAAAIAATQVTLFVIPPIGAVPEGGTVLISRTAATRFVDSPDSVCERIQGGVSLLCRGIVIGQIGNNATVLARLPYSDMLYLWSTDGRRYDR